MYPMGIFQFKIRYNQHCRPNSGAINRHPKVLHNIVEVIVSILLFDGNGGYILTRIVVTTMVAAIGAASLSIRSTKNF